MRALLPVANADTINEAHRLARSMAENAVEQAITCGRLLIAKKRESAHGDFRSWVEENCSFGYDSAKRYMHAAKQTTKGIAFDSLRQYFPGGRISKKTDSKKNQVVTDQKGNAFPFSPAPQRGTQTTAKSAAPPEAPQTDEPERPDWELDEDAKLEAIEREVAQSIDRVMQSDDRLAAAHTEIKRQAEEIVVLKASRDHYQNEAGAAVRLVKTRDREIEKLRRTIAKAAA